MLRDEVVYKSEAQGQISFFKEEGDKVGKGVKIYEILNSDSDLLQNEIEEIDKQIAVLKDFNESKETFSQDVEKNQNEIEFIVKEMRKYLMNKDYYKASISKDLIYQKLDKHQTITGQNTLASMNIESLMNKKEQLILNSNKSKLVKFSDKTGIVSFNIDGLEEIYGANKLDEFDINDFNIIEPKQVDARNNKEVTLGDPVCKIINSYKWYVMIHIDEDEFGKLEAGSRLFLKINDDSRKISAKVVKISKAKGDMLIIFEIDDYLHEFYNERYIDVKLIKNTYKGLIIPNDVIIEKYGLKGVHIKDISGIVKFRPIKIIGANDEYTIVSEGENKQIEIEVNGKVENMYTIQMFDEVYLYGDRVKEGQILN